MRGYPDFSLHIRPFWYDRNAMVIKKQYTGAQLLPHSTTKRWAYTVPAGRKAYLEFAQIRVLRRTAATTANLAEVWIDYQEVGGALDMFLVAAILDNTVGAKDSQIIGQSILFFAGDLLECYTTDASVGGTIDIGAYAKFTEFDE